MAYTQGDRNGGRSMTIPRDEVVRRLFDSYAATFLFDGPPPPAELPTAWERFRAEEGEPLAAAVRRLPVTIPAALLLGLIRGAEFAAVVDLVFRWVAEQIANQVHAEDVAAGRVKTAFRVGPGGRLEQVCWPVPPPTPK